MAQDDAACDTDPADAPRSARVEYRAKLERARTMIATLAQLLDDHALEHVRKPDRWDLVGDLGALNEELGEAAAAIERTELPSTDSCS
jgi:hypothetical protein